MEKTEENCARTEVWLRMPLWFPPNAGRSCFTQEDISKGKKGNSPIKKERKRKRQKGKEIEKKGMAICSDVARRMAGREGRPDFSTIRCCVSLNKLAAFSEPL